jgi:excisionase family DNA binding protein
MKEIAGIKLYTVQETAKLLEVTAQTIRKYIKEGKLKAQRVGRPFYIAESSIKEFLKGVI